MQLPLLVQEAGRAANREWPHERALERVRFDAHLLWRVAHQPVLVRLRDREIGALPVRVSPGGGDAQHLSQRQVRPALAGHHRVDHALDVGEQRRHVMRGHERTDAVVAVEHPRDAPRDGGMGAHDLRDRALDAAEQRGRQRRAHDLVVPQRQRKPAAVRVRGLGSYVHQRELADRSRATLSVLSDQAYRFLDHLVGV